MPHTCIFLPNATMSGCTPACSCAHNLPVMPKPVCTSSKISSASFSSASRRSAAQELGAEVVVAALALDRLDDDRGDVVRPLDERLLDLGSACALDRRDALEFGARPPGSAAPGW